MLDLAGVDESGAHSVALAVPGDATTALHKAGVIPDHCWGRNEYDCRWMCERDWVAARDFTHDGGAADLVVEGLDTVAELRLNGEIVLSAANAHRRWRVPVIIVQRHAPGRAEVRLRANADDRAVDAAHLSTDTLRPDEILSFTWRRPDQPHRADIFAPKPWKAYDLPAATLTHSIEPARDGWQIIIDTDRPAFFVAIEADQPGRFDKNAFALYPGYAAIVIFTPQTQGPAPRLTLRDLYSATYGPPPGPKG